MWSVRCCAVCCVVVCTAVVRCVYHGRVRHFWGFTVKALFAFSYLEFQELLEDKEEPKIGTAGHFLLRRFSRKSEEKSLSTKLVCTDNYFDRLEITRNRHLVWFVFCFWFLPAATLVMCSALLLFLLGLLCPSHGIRDGEIIDDTSDKVLLDISDRFESAIQELRFADERHVFATTKDSFFYTSRDGGR